MTERLDGRVAIVTGAASGIGRATAVAFAEAGITVFALDLKAPDEVCETIRKKGGRIEGRIVDISREADVVEAVASCRATFGQLDFAVNCAGVAHECPLLETTVEDFDRVIGVNLRGTFLVGREAIRVLKEQGEGGRVINLASELAYLGRADHSSYCASKGGVLSLTRSWAREFAPEILVNAIAPGPIDTPMLGPEFMSAEVRAKETDIPLGRLGRPEEVAAVALFLCGSGATYMTGQTLGPNGGAVMA
jgi:3-oxoacyl-[acyl-carrier protein] reductase